MTTTNNYFAQPYDLGAIGFYFKDMEDYQSKYDANINRLGCPVEEYEIQIIDGDEPELFKACGIDQSNLEQWFDEIEGLDDSEKIALFYLMDNNIASDLKDAISKVNDVGIYEGELKQAAEELFDDCYLHDVPEHVQSYIDYDKFARDCEYEGDMTEFVYEGTTYTCTNANGI